MKYILICTALIISACTPTPINAESDLIKPIPEYNVFNNGVFETRIWSTSVCVEGQMFVVFVYPDNVHTQQIMVNYCSQLSCSNKYLEC